MSELASRQIVNFTRSGETKPDSAHGEMGRDETCHRRRLDGGGTLIVLGLVLLVIGFIAKIPILWSIGILVLVIGLVLALLGAAGREVGGRKHYF